MTTRLLLVRHGETDSNVEGRTQGRREVSLNALGERQAAALAERLAQFAPEAIYVSTARRAQQTAAPLARATGLTPMVDARLAELDQGELDGMTGEQMRHGYPDFLRRWGTEDPTDLRMPGGETMGEAQDRMAAALLDVTASHPQAVAVIVSHNLALHALLCHAMGIPLRAFRQFRIDLAAFTLVEAVQADRWTVVTLNERCHLPGADLPTEAVTRS